MAIDSHHHIIPESIINLIRKGDSRFEAEIQVKDNKEWIVHQQGYAYPLFDKFYDSASKEEDLTLGSLDQLVLSPAPPMFYYWLKPDTAKGIAELVNDGVAEMMNDNDFVHRAMATVPMQDPKLAIKELERVKDQYGIQAVEIGTSIEGVNLDDPQFIPFFEAADAMEFTLFLHPYYVGDKSGLGKYYFTNLIGNPLDTTLAAGSLIFGGLLDKFKNMKVLLAHGGGYFPYQIGRFDKGYQERAESRTCADLPSTYLNRFYFDTLTFQQKPLEFLIDLVSENNVVLGSDYPFDMGTLDPLAIVNDSNFASAAKEKIVYENALKLFK